MADPAKADPIDKPVYNDEQKELIKVATFLQKQGLKEKEAIANRKRVYYFRANMFHELMLDHKEEILKMLSKHVKFEELETVEDSCRLGDIMINNGLVNWFERIKDEVKKYKYPKKLVQSTGSMKESGFYGFDIYKPQTKMTFIAIGLAVAIIAIILFPLWPYSVKLAIFNCLFYFTASFLGMTVVRLLIWIALFPFGIDFWIFPNLFDDDAGLIESFMPILLLNRREDSWLVFVLRLLMILSFAGYCYTQAGLPLPIDSSFEIYNDVFEWGKDKMVGNETTSLQYAGNHRPTLEDILKATEEYEKEEQEEKERQEEEAQEKKDQAESEEAREDL